jgi:hypothetical protein
MRHIITAGDDAQYRELQSYLMSRYREHVRVASERRRFFSVENLPDQGLSTVRRSGASVAEEFQYSPDHGGSSPTRTG